MDNVNDVVIRYVIHCRLNERDIEDINTLPVT